MVDHFIQHLLGEYAVGGNDGDADGGSPPDVVIVNLGSRDIELVPQMSQQAFQHLPLVFERVGFVDLKFSGQQSNGHGIGPRREAGASLLECARDALHLVAFQRVLRAILHRFLRVVAGD